MKTIFIAIALAAPGLALAGDGNNALITQDSTNSLLTGNTLFIDQSDADNALVAGSNAGVFDGTSPASQTGAGNRAVIDQDGFGARAALTQGPNALGLAQNDATINITGGGSAILEQLGFANDGTLTTNGLGTATLLQNGDENIGTVTVNGTGQGTLIQSGNRNELGLNVSGAAQATYQQVGNDLSSPTGAQVISNAGSVFITQRAIGSN